MKAIAGGVVAVVLLGLYAYLVYIGCAIVQCAANSACAPGSAGHFNDVQAHGLDHDGSFSSGRVRRHHLRHARAVSAVRPNDRTRGLRRAIATWTIVLACLSACSTVPRLKPEPPAPSAPTDLALKTPAIPVGTPALIEQRTRLKRQVISAAASLPGKAPDLCVFARNDVVTSVTVRDSPKAGAATVAKLLPSQALPLQGEVPNWYRVAVSDQVTGFVSKRWAVVRACDGGPSSPADEDVYQLDAIDVGTGLSIFVKGPDFTLLYDAGSNDDKGLGNDNRVLAYLAAEYPNVTELDHVVLSHPHQDHVLLLADVLRKYPTAEIWDSGAYNDICGYRDFLRAVSESRSTLYHDALHGAGNEQRDLPTTQEDGKPSTCTTRGSAGVITLHHGEQIDTAPVPLGAHAHMEFLHIDGKPHANPNDNSLVLKLVLGNHAVLLMGDAEAGGRAAPSVPPTKKSVEGQLLECCKGRLGADVLVAGHHGSMTSSRKLVLDEIGASYYIVSSGPHAYGSVVLPDPIVCKELSRRGILLATDLDDDSCSTNPGRVGSSTEQPGGCTSVRIVLRASSVETEYLPPLVGQTHTGRCR